MANIRTDNTRGEHVPTEINALLLAAASNDQTASFKAVHDLWETVASPDTEPPAYTPDFLARCLILAKEPGTTMRADLLNLVTHICLLPVGDSCDTLTRGEVLAARDWRHADVVREHLDGILELLGDVDPEARHAAARLASTCVRDAGRVSAALFGRWDTETDIAVRVTLTFAIAFLSRSRRDYEDETEDWLDNLATNHDQPPALRLAGLLGGLRWDKIRRLTHQHAEILLATLHDEVSEIFAKSPLAAHISKVGLVEWFLDQFHAPGHHADRVVRALTEAGADSGIRLSATAALGNLIGRLDGTRPRTHGDRGFDLRPVLPKAEESRANRLTERLGVLLLDNSHHVQRQAAVACTHLKARHIWSLAEPLRKTTKNPSTATAGWASAALARIGDEGAVDGIIRVLRDTDCVWDCSGDASEAIIHMRPFAPRIIPALKARLLNPNESWSLPLEVILGQLAGWGRDASPLAKAVFDFGTSQWCSTELMLQVLGAIGPAATPATTAIHELLDGDPEDLEVAVHGVWALWRISGNTTHATRILGAAIREGHTCALETVADMGINAAGNEKDVRKAAEHPSWGIEERATAAWALFRITGHTEDTLEALITVLDGMERGRSIDSGATWAVERLSMLGPAAVAASEAIERLRYHSGSNPEFGSLIDKTLSRMQAVRR